MGGGNKGGGQSASSAMLSGEQPCFQLLRIGLSTGDSARDLYTFRPALSHSVFRLGRAAELCDVTLDSTFVSRIHAELYAEREPSEEDSEEQEEGWKVHIKDRSSHGTWVNEVRLQPGIPCDLTDGDTLTFGGQTPHRNPEFYFLFQKVKVRPLEFDAITIPKGGTFSSDLQNRIRTNLDCKEAANLDPPNLSINRATVILNSIGSLSKMKGRAWTFKRSHSQEGAASDPGTSSSSPVISSSLLPPSTSPSLSTTALVTSTKPGQAASRSRRKSAHTVLLEDDSSDEPRRRCSKALTGIIEDGARARPKKRRKLYKSESEAPPPPQPHVEAPRPADVKPFPVGIRTIGSFHGAMTNSVLNHQLLQSSYSINPCQPEAETSPRVKTEPHDNMAAQRPQKPARSSPTAQRGRRRANSSPVFSPLVVGGEKYNLASPSVRIPANRSRQQFGRFSHPISKQRGRPRKLPLITQPASLPSPSSSSSSSTSSASSSDSDSSSGSSSSDDEGEDECVTGVGVEPCAAPRCRLPQQDTVQWIQCDVCDAWYHIDCLQLNRKKILKDPNADFHCGCR